MTPSSPSPESTAAAEDEALLQALRSDDTTRSAAALREIIRQHADAICTVAAYEVDADVACDIGQQLMADLWDRRATISIPGSLRAYLLKAVRLQLTQLHRNAQTASRCLVANRPPGPTAAENDALTWLLLDDGHRTIQALQLHAEAPQQYRTFGLSFYYGLSPDEIAESLHISTRTVHRHLRWVRTRIYQALLDRGFFEARELQHFVTQYSTFEEDHHA